MFRLRNLLCVAAVAAFAAAPAYASSGPPGLDLLAPMAASVAGDVAGDAIPAFGLDEADFAFIVCAGDDCRMEAPAIDLSIAWTGAVREENGCMQEGDAPSWGSPPSCLVPEVPALTPD